MLLALLFHHSVPKGCKKTSSEAPLSLSNGVKPVVFQWLGVRMAAGKICLQIRLD